MYFADYPGWSDVEIRHFEAMERDRKARTEMFKSILGRSGTSLKPLVYDINHEIPMERMPFLLKRLGDTKQADMFFDYLCKQTEKVYTQSYGNHQVDTIWLPPDLYNWLSSIYDYFYSGTSCLKKLANLLNFSVVRKQELFGTVVLFDSDKSNMTCPDDILWLFDKTGVLLKRPRSAMVLLDTYLL